MSRGLNFPITRVADLDDDRPRFVFPTWGLRLGSTPETRRYLFLGYPDFRRSQPPWRYLDRMGAFHRLKADGVQVTIVAHKRGWLTEASLVVDRQSG